jgi:hypothetical protein
MSSQNIESTDLKDEITNFLSKIQNKYSGGADQKHLNQMYDIGIIIANRKFDKDRLINKLTIIINKRSDDPLKQVRDMKKRALLEALSKGVEDGSSDTYRQAYDQSNRYRYDGEKLEKRGYIDGVLDMINGIGKNILS